MKNFETLVIEDKGESLWISLNREDTKNAFSRQLTDELIRCVRHIHQNEKSRRAVVFTGKGSVFCAGADLKERKSMSEKEVKNFLETLNSLFFQIVELPMPTICMLNGPALGGGCELSLCTDFRIGVDTLFFSLPEVSLGIIPGAGGTQRLPPLIGLSRAKEMILTGEKIPAPKALEWGLLTKSVPAEKLMAETESFIQVLSQNAPLSLQQAKAALQQSQWATSPTQGLKFEQDCYNFLLDTEDRKEALKAFADKRKPNFKGH